MEKNETFEVITEATDLGFSNLQKIWVDKILMRLCTKIQLSILIFRVKLRLPKFWAQNFGSSPPPYQKVGLRKRGLDPTGCGRM